MTRLECPCVLLFDSEYSLGPESYYILLVLCFGSFLLKASPLA